MESESRAIKQEALRFIWWMRGGLSYDEAMALGLEERKIIDEIIKDNMKATKESGMPFF
jgi:hypothetical protein